MTVIPVGDLNVYWEPGYVEDDWDNSLVDWNVAYPENLFWGGEQQYEGLDTLQHQVAGHHKAVAPVVTFSAANGYFESGHIREVRFQSANHAASGVLHQQETGNAIALGCQSINHTHLGSG
jgi:hypothetical protein